MCPHTLILLCNSENPRKIEIMNELLFISHNSPRRKSLWFPYLGQKQSLDVNGCSPLVSSASASHQNASARSPPGKHTAHNFIRSLEMTVCTPRHTDLNIFECYWFIWFKMARNQLKITEDLRFILKNVWNDLPVISFKQHCGQTNQSFFFKVKCDHTKYWFDLSVFAVYSSSVNLGRQKKKLFTLLTVECPFFSHPKCYTVDWK